MLNFKHRCHCGLINIKRSECARPRPRPDVNKTTMIPDLGATYSL